MNSGENFTVRFTVTNSFIGSDGEAPGHAHFTDVKRQVFKTGYAEPLDGDGATYDLTAHLGFGNSVARDVAFGATAMKPIVFNPRANPLLQDPTEPYVRARATGKFGLLRFFEIVQDETFNTQITTLGT